MSVQISRHNPPLVHTCVMSYSNYLTEVKAVGGQQKQRASLITLSNLNNTARCLGITILANSFDIRNFAEFHNIA